MFEVLKFFEYCFEFCVVVGCEEVGLFDLVVVGYVVGEGVELCVESMGLSVVEGGDLVYGGNVCFG